MATSEFGRRVASLRVKLDMTQEQLAVAAGVSEKTVYNVEAGMTPRKSTMNKLMDALGVEEFSGAGLFAGGPEPADLTRLETAALALLRIADAESVRSVAIGMVEELDRDQLEGLIADLSLIIGLETGDPILPDLADDEDDEYDPLGDDDPA